jgi:hypothetical protein
MFRKSNLESYRQTYIENARSIFIIAPCILKFHYLPALGTTCIDTRYAATPLVELTKCFTDYFNIFNITSARNYVCSLMMMIDRSKHVGTF